MTSQPGKTLQLGTWARQLAVMVVMPLLLTTFSCVPADPPAEVDIVLVTPAPGALLVGTVAVRVALEPEDSVAAVVFTANGERIGTAFSPPFEVLFDTRTAGDGPVMLRAETVPLAGAVAEASVEVDVENEAPELAILEPIDGELFFTDAPLPIHVVADDGSGVEWIELSAVGELAHVEVIEWPASSEIDVMVPIDTLFPAGVTAPADVIVRVTVMDTRGRSSVASTHVRVAPRLKWHFDTLGEIAASPTVMPDGRVLVSSRSGDVIVLDAEGQELCRFDGSADDPIISSPVPSGDGATVYFGSERFLRAMDSGCTLLWTYAAEGVYFSTPTVHPTTGTLYAASYDGVLHAIAPGGAGLWSIPVGLAGIEAPLLLDPAGDRLYVASLDYSLHALAPQDGAELWTFLTGRELYAAPVVHGADLVLGSADGYVYAISRADGALSWPIGLETDGPVRAPAAVASDGTIYVTSQDRNLHAIVPDGTAIWAAETAGFDRAGPAIAGDGTIVAGSTDGSVLAFSPTGELLWSFETFDAIQATPVIVDGIVYVASWDRRLYALYVSPAAALADGI